MSLRGRLTLVLIVACVALIAAASMTFETISESDAVQLRVATSIVDSMVDRLRGAIPSDASCRTALPSIPDVAVGYCSSGGDIGPSLARGGRGELVDHALPPDLRAAVMGACARRDDKVQRVVHPHDVTTFRVASGAWALVRTQMMNRSTSVASIVVLAVSTLLLVVLTLTSLRSIRDGARTLSRSLVSLQGDLRARIERPRIAELDVVADGLGTMASHLADSIDRERDLGRRLAHEQRLAALGRVVAGVAHEVRNPLTGLKLRLDLLRAGKRLEHTDLAEVEGALEEVQRLDRLVTLLLSAARQPLKKQAVTLHELVDARIEALSEYARSHGARVSRHGEAMVMTDRDAVARIVDNLLRNAIEVSTVVVVKLHDADSPSIEVMDQGPGAADESLLFEPFATTKPEGLGLGLFLARTTAESLGGSLRYRRNLPWTILCLTLPSS